MSEDVYYWCPPGEPSRAIFMHSHLADLSGGRVVVFVDPLFDEKRRVQRFQADLARALCRDGLCVYRYDHYGTGDSGGQVRELDCPRSLADLASLCAAVRACHPGSVLELFGVRLGADLCLRHACDDETVERLWLLEPIVHGAQFLKEHRLRRQMHRKINRMDPDEQEHVIGEQRFEDYQGYLLSQASRELLEALSPASLSLRGRMICLLKCLKAGGRATAMLRLREVLGRDNDVRYEEVAYPDFWAMPQPPEVSLLTRCVREAFLTHSRGSASATASDSLDGGA